MQLTQQIRITPTEQQIDILWKLSEKCRLIYNFALEERRSAFEQGIKGISYYKQQNDLPEIKQQYPEYIWVYSKVLQYVLQTLNADYKSFYALWKKGDNDARPPHFKGKKYFTTMVYNQSGFKYYQNKIQLSHKCNKTPLEFEIPKKFKFSKIYQISIYRRDGDFYLSVTYEQAEKPYADNGLYQAFDLGATKQVAVNLEGRFVEFANERPDKYWDESLKKLQSRRDHCRKYSRKWRELNRLHNKCKRKSSNQLKDFQHKLSRKIVDNTRANTIIVGELSVKELCKIDAGKGKKFEKGLHRSIHNTGNIGRLVGFLAYKSKLAGKRLIEINERRTTRECCCCGKEHDMPLWKRTMICDCGNNIDRDRNSSINIMCRYLSQNGLWTAYQQFVGNLRQTGIPIVRELYS